MRRGWDDVAFILYHLLQYITIALAAGSPVFPCGDKISLKTFFPHGAAGGIHENARGHGGIERFGAAVHGKGQLFLR